ncbi:MAG: Phosphatidate cytidylyltransferase [uncultured Solirubrobacteraceae bacterium]|uniref:Phosphatidate cytidylyltransferase n=1 Tax=uncultured Solirubrobacteraceae bacterium TaxID=1162706 RepID=A0A6J4TGW5_9ACTN|nr:MAG: Phosphatidate cytidylyltransferase [uncultured Solirubrobacteraceae bacterium]
MALGAAVVIAAGLAPAGHRRAALVATALGVAWLGVCLAHGVLLRELPHGGGLLIAVLLATFLGDTAAQLVGTAFGRTRLAPAISPNKTVEGLLAGVAGGTLACWAFAVLGPDWLTAGDALVLGLACSLAAPAGDLFESALKRRAGVKDSGRVFGAHGGALDRVDAALAAAVAGYYVAHGLIV